MGTLIKDFIPNMPEESLNGKFKGHFRTVEEFSEMFPLLTQSELVDLKTQVDETQPGSWRRKQVIEYFSTLNHSRTSEAL